METKPEIVLESGITYHIIEKIKIREKKELEELDNRYTLISVWGNRSRTGVKYIVKEPFNYDNLKGMYPQQIKGFLDTECLEKIVFGNEYNYQAERFMLRHCISKMKCLNIQYSFLGDCRFLESQPVDKLDYFTIINCNIY